jgi:hypothetical protein
MLSWFQIAVFLSLAQMISMVRSFGSKSSFCLTRTLFYSKTKALKGLKANDIKEASFGEVIPSSGDYSRKKKAFCAIPFVYHQELILDIDNMSNLGLGIARHVLPDGSKWVVMVPLVLPGKVVPA